MLGRLFAPFHNRQSGRGRFGIRRWMRNEPGQRGTAARPAPVDVRHLGNDPRSVGYHDRPVLVEAPLATCRYASFEPVQNGSHPFVLTAHLAATGNSQANVRRPLELHHEQQRQCPPPSQIIRPWDARPAPVRDDKRSRSGARLQRHGAHEFAALHAGRIVRLIESVRKHGLTRHDGPGGDIEGIALIASDGRWRWQVQRGNHRVAVFDALAIAQVPVRITRVIREDEVDVWPQVAAGACTRAAALRTFRRLFDGVPADGAQPGEPESRT